MVVAFEENKWEVHQHYGLGQTKLEGIDRSGVFYVSGNVTLKF